MARGLPDARESYDGQVERLAGELAEAQTSYEERLKAQIEELSNAREVYEGQIRRLAREVAQVRAESETLRARRADELAELESRIAEFQAQLERQAAAHSEAQTQLLERNTTLVEVHSQLLRKDEVLNWIYASRSWKVVTSFRRVYHHWGVRANGMLRRLHLPAKDAFLGAIESPAPNAVCSGYMDISGWVASATGRVTLVEAFLDGYFLGAVRYSSERPDVAAALPPRAGKVYGYAERLVLSGSFAGQRTLTIRAFDQHGHSHLFASPVTVTEAREPAPDEDAPSAGRVAPEAPLESKSPAPPAEVLGRRELTRTDFLSQMEEIVNEFESRTGRAPFILDWNTNLRLSEAFPQLAVMSPCAANSGDRLPYLDHTVDIVVLPARGGDELAEARRVASAAVVRVEGLRLGLSGRLTVPKVPGRLRLTAEWRGAEALRAVPPETSIIVPVYNKVEYTRNCLVQLRRTLPPNFRGEIIVVDDASLDETPAVVAEFAAADARIRSLRNEQNLGFIRSCNRAAAAATGEVLIFLNNDTLPQPGWLLPLLKVLQEYPDAGAVGGKLLYPDGTLQEAGGVIFSDASGCNFGRHDRAAGAPLYSFLREVDYCSGALLATRRELFQRLGGFDERYAPAYYEDTDYCFALREKGYHVYYQPESVIIHFEGVTSGTDLGSGVKKYQEINRAKFQAKWKHFLQHHPPPPRHYDFTTLHELSVRSWTRVSHDS
jgi:GT2 family glycosyltransferase